MLADVAQKVEQGHLAEPRTIVDNLDAPVGRPSPQRSWGFGRRGVRLLAVGSGAGVAEAGLEQAEDLGPDAREIGVEHCPVDCRTLGGTARRVAYRARRPADLSKASVRIVGCKACTRCARWADQSNGAVSLKHKVE